MTTLEVRDEVENELMNESTKDAVQHRFEFKDSSARMVKGILTSIQELMKIGTSGASDVVDYANKSHGLLSFPPFTCFEIMYPRSKRFFVRHLIAASQTQFRAKDNSERESFLPIFSIKSVFIAVHIKAQ